MECHSIKEIERRAKLWRREPLGKFQVVFKNKIPICLKRKAFDQCILPVLTYGSKTWITDVKAIQKL